MLCPICSTPNVEQAISCHACGSTLSARLIDDISDALAVGTVLQNGAFIINRVLGQGGFGITYLSADIRLKRSVAIKEFFPFGSRRRDSTVVPPHTLTPDGFQTARTHFLDEARILAQFHHPNIVHVHSAFEENGTVYMVMELMHGKTLQDLVDTQGALPEETAVRYISKVGEALEEVHRAGLLHRDIKPDNVMATDDGRIVLFDFGTTRAFTSDTTKRMTSIVTPGYAPLEQYGQQARFGPFTDIYALGATLYHLLIGEAPVQATDRVAGVDLSAPHQLQPHISQRVSDAVMWALELKVDQRPQSVHKFLEALHGGGDLALLHGQDKSLSGTLGRIATARPVEAMTDSGRTDDTPNWPQKCACCGGPNDTTLQVIYPHGGAITPQTRIWMVPYCSKCKDHVSIDRSSAAFFSAGPALVSGSVVSLFLTIGSEIPFILMAWFFMGVPFTLFRTFKKQRDSAQDLMKSTCSDAGPAVRCISCHTDMRNHRIYTFQFKNHHYEAEFKQQNPPRLR